MLVHEPIVRLFAKIIFQPGGIATIPLATIDPTIKTFVITSIILGPISIALLILILKRIEKNDPNRIRWR